MASKRFISLLTKSILKGTLMSSSFICLKLFELGEITLDSFLPANYSFARPYRRLLGLEMRDWRPTKNSLQVGLTRLVEQGFAEKKRKSYKLTLDGKRIMKSIFEKQKSLKKKWDGKYRLVIFDIPEFKKKARDWLREELYLLQYIQLQKSVFIGKHPLSQDIIGDIKGLGLSNHVNYLLIEKVYDERKLKFLEPN